MSICRLFYDWTGSWQTGKMSLNELSEKVGIANVNLSKIKTGKVSAIRFSTLEAICEALNCQPGEILEYQKSM